MSEWTETARRVLDEYCARSKAVLAGTGADADEVEQDLRLHVEAEVSAAQLKIVTENDIRRILARFGDPGSATEKTAAAKAPAAALEPGKERKRPGFILLILGVVLPLGTLIFELVTGASAGVLFDPLPSWIHIAAVALVPALNFWIWRAGRAQDSRHSRLLGWLNGIALGICLYYMVLYLPVLPFAVVGVVYFGFGLIPLTPLLTLVATAWIRFTYSRRIGQEELPGAAWGLAAGCGFLVLLQMPVALTYYGLARASAEDKETRLHGVNVLRTFGDEDLILRACYGLLQRREINLDVVRYLASGNHKTSPEQAREVYYRVTGKPFNSVPPPSIYTRAGRWMEMEREFEWDDALGGETVAGRVKGLSLLSSRMDAVAEPDASIVYCEWTLEFKNVATQPREARAQIALPPGSVVSRLTLWIDGEEREAAFGGRSQVRQAYQEVAVVRRRDPVLIATCGPDRVLMQCFPVPANGGVMKVRIGITAPLILDSLEQGQFLWPRLLERNFGIAADFRHGLWMESSSQLSGDPSAVTTTKTATRPFTLHQTVSEVDAGEASQRVTVRRSAEVLTVWSPAEKGEIIWQTIRPMPVRPPARVVLVVDGSVGMDKSVREIAESLAELPAGTEVAVIVASDQPRMLNEKPEKASPEVLSALERSLRNARFVGGQDNLPALEAAWEIARPVENSAVIWIHQPQSALLSSESTLRQCIERSAGTTRLFEVQTRNGPDRIVEKLDGLAAVGRVPRFGSLRSDLSNLFAEWSGKRARFELARERITTSPDSTAGPSVSKHLERLWARDETLRLVAQRHREAAVKLATDHQLVTPLTGAVVLETRQQYTQSNLTPADPNTVPAVPEPSTLSLVGMGIAAWLARRHFRRQGARGET